ncbi:ROK family transcriptional regulator [Prauserella muralis]|uniref:Sugar kinase n=1 Tax=Prauserella muralis TaxID=588067 RepID=A0A2V4BDM6_9PSEU|nr:ROK family transcriptional regulator [Prauserella muralis]PXY27729.1 sugar kinase [Prauserella muralis]TWE22523.1 glucokinase [Prauserella muralis]
MTANAGPAEGVPGRGALFQLLRDGRPRTRAELSAETGLARSTIADRIDRLLAAGLLRYADKAGSTGGRPPSMFAFNPAARVVLAADVGATHVTVAVADLGGSVIAEREHAIDIADGPEAVLGDVVANACALLTEAGRRRQELLGIGVGLPGPVEHATGRPVRPPIMPGWDGFDVRTYLHERLGVVSLVDNDVNLMALGEHRTHWPESPNMMFVKVATGIGSGLVSDGRLHRGSRGAAGDLGHVQAPHGEDVPCRCGNLGCLEAVASGAAVAARLKARGLPVESGVDVVALARNGSVDALRALRQAGRDIGEVLAAAVSLFNPSVIVVGGALSQAGEHLIAGVREVVYRRSLPLATEELRIVQSRAGDQAGVLGAAAMVIDHALSPQELDALLAG